MDRSWMMVLLLAACSFSGGEARRARGEPVVFQANDVNETTVVVDNQITCASFVNIPEEAVPCFCEPRTNNRFTTNGLCRRKGKGSACQSGLTNVMGLCAGTAAIQPSDRKHCLSGLMFTTGTCVPNEMLYENSERPSGRGAFTASLECASQLYIDGVCANNIYNVSIHAGMRSDQVVYFPSDDQPVFVGSCAPAENNIQVTYCSTPPVWAFPHCNHDFGFLGWTRAWSWQGCTADKNWRKETSACGPHAINVEGTGGSQCFGYEKDGWVSNVAIELPWKRWSGEPFGHELPEGPVEKDWLKLPRVVIVSGKWSPERQRL